MTVYDPTLYEPGKPFVEAGDSRLNRALHGHPEAYATVSEYAAATGIPHQQVIQFLAPALQAGYLLMEYVGDEEFIHTAPQGRPAPAHLPQVAPNLWENLRSHADPSTAYALWQLARGLQAAGWELETRPSRLLFGLGGLTHRPHLGVRVGERVVPLLNYPSLQDLSASLGLLTEYERSGAPIVAVTVAETALDPATTAVRKWMLNHPVGAALHVLVLEAPRFDPVHLDPSDAAVAARPIGRSEVSALARALPQG